MTNVEAKFLSRKDLMDAFCIKSHHTIESMIKKGQIPSPFYVGRLPRWPAHVLTDIQNAGKMLANA